MKLRYVVALLMIVIMMGCATETPPAEPAPAEEPVEEVAPAEEPVEEVAPAEEPVEEEAETEISDADQKRIDNLKASCERGAANLCLVLKNTYGIDWPPAVAEEPEASDEEAETAE